jgi:hypothetical protein
MPKHIAFGLCSVALLGFLAISLGLAMMVTCFSFAYVSFEGQPGFRVIEWTRYPIQRAAITTQSIPVLYEVQRARYRLEVTTGEYSFPTFAIKATTLDGVILDVVGPGADSRKDLSMSTGVGPAIPKGVTAGQWSFEVLRDGQAIGRETIGYEIRSLPFACEWNVI